MTRGEAWQRLGAKMSDLPVDYTGSTKRERPVGTYQMLQVRQQIPAHGGVDEHMQRFRRFVDMVKGARTEIMADAEKHREGKKHVYLQAHEPASGGVERSRMKPDKYPVGTSAATLKRAYNHAALLAMHDHGLVDYDFKMDDALKSELTPVEPFILYARRRLNEKAATAFPGQRGQYLSEFGQSRMKRKNGKDTGIIATRFRPNQQMIKAAPLGNLRAGLRSFVHNNAFPESSLLHAGGHAFGHWAGNSARLLVRNPLAWARETAGEGARTGAGMARGFAEGAGMPKRYHDAAARVGAVAGAGKVAVVGGMAAYHPLKWAFGHGNAPGNRKKKSPMLKAAPKKAIVHAAGLMITTQHRGNTHVLLLKRGAHGAQPGTWCFPGGHIEPGETPREAALRETSEETGFMPVGLVAPVTRRVADGVDFTTFHGVVARSFQPVMNNEHIDWCWASPDNLPSPMHPGCAVALATLKKPLAKGLPKVATAAARIIAKAPGEVRDLVMRNPKKTAALAVGALAYHEHEKGRRRRAALDMAALGLPPLNGAYV